MVKHPPANAGDIRDVGSIPGSGRYPGGGNGSCRLPVFLPGEFHGQRSLEDCSPRGHKESDTTEHLSDVYTIFILLNEGFAPCKPCKFYYYFSFTYEAAELLKSKCCKNLNPMSPSSRSRKS